MKSDAEVLVDLLNQYVEIVEADGNEEEGLEYLVAEFKPNENLDSFVTELFCFLDRLAPIGYHAVVGEKTGFELVPDKES